MPKTYILVRDADIDHVERATGLRGHPTRLGVLIERPAEFDLEAALDRLDRAMHPSRCNCGRSAIIHRPNCPMAYCVS